MGYDQIKKDLRSLANEEKRKFLPKFFKTGKGEYGEGDKFLGVVVPDIKQVAAKHLTIEKKEILKLLYSEWHEERFCGWLIVLNNFNNSKNKEGVSIDDELPLSFIKNSRPKESKYLKVIIH